jgi:hypothetical protein
MRKLVRFCGSNRYVKFLCIAVNVDVKIGKQTCAKVIHILGKSLLNKYELYSINRESSSNVAQNEELL